jgi:tetratricopeptide (TPR) repeat protein
LLPVTPPEQNEDALFERAQAAEEIGDRAEAERLYRGLMKSDPTDAAPPFNLGNMLQADGRKVEAEAAFRAATRADPMFAEAWYNLSDLLDEQGRAEAAIDFAQGAARRPGIRRRDVQSCASTTAKQSAQRSGGVLAALSSE